MTVLIISGALLLAAVLIILFTPLWKNHRSTVLYMSAGIVSSAIALYMLLGAPQIIRPAEEAETQRQTREADIAMLSHELAQHRQDLNLWVRLGRQLASLGDYAKASGAFKQAVVLSQGNPEMILLYARSLTLAAGGKVTPDAQKGFTMVQRLEPDNLEAAFFLSLAQWQQGKKAEAKAAFSRLERQLPEGHPLKKELEPYLVSP